MEGSIGQHAVKLNGSGRHLHLEQERNLEIGSKAVSARLTDNSDESLVALVKKGSEAAYAELVKRYMRASYAIAYQVVGDMDVARDLSQDVFLKIYTSISKFKEGSKFSPWFYRIVLNHSINFTRRKKVLSFVPFSSYFSGAENSNEEFPNEQESFDEVSDRQSVVREAVEKLPLKHKKVVILCDLEGFPQEEAAEIIGVAVGTVRSRLHYARKELKEQLKHYINEI